MGCRAVLKTPFMNSNPSTRFICAGRPRLNLQVRARYYSLPKIRPASSPHNVIGRPDAESRSGDLGWRNGFATLNKFNLNVSAAKTFQNKINVARDKVVKNKRPKR